MLDTSTERAAGWIQVRANGRSREARWYCTPLCAAAGLHPDATGSLVLRWTGTVDVPGPDDPPESGCQVHLVTAGGGPAVLVLDGTQRLALSSLLDTQIRDITRPCPTERCGAEDEEGADPDAVPWGWIRLQVAGTGSGLRWWCSPMCVSAAIARAGDELAEEYVFAVAHGAGTVSDGGEGW